MTDQEIIDIGPAFAKDLRRYNGCCGQDRTASHLRTYCRGLLSDLPRKTAEPIALVAGTPVRTLQAFLVTSAWDEAAARTTLQRYLTGVVAEVPDDGVGTVGVIDETSCQKWGHQTPGVQRQYLGCVGKVESGVVTVHVGVARGRFQALLDADLYLPNGWDEDRPRCREAGIPDDVGYRPKWRIAMDQLIRLGHRGVTFDWLTFDEGYGAAVPFLHLLASAGQKFVAEIPVNFSVREVAGGPARRADARLAAVDARSGARHRLTHRTVKTSVWRAKKVIVWVGDRQYALVVAMNEETEEIKYFLTNARSAGVPRILAVAFRRWTIEHLFRLAKQEAGLTHFEGRDYTGLMRHLSLALVVLGFVATHTERLRGEKPTRHGRAGVPCAEPEVPNDHPEETGDPRPGAHR